MVERLELAGLDAIMARIISALLALTALGACTVGERGLEPATSDAVPAEEPLALQPAPAKKTRILDKEGLDRLLGNKGITLQWIDWNVRGSLFARMEGDLLRLAGVQNSADGAGKLSLNGSVAEIAAGYFTFDGTIRITDTPDPGRVCEATKMWRFGITQNRPYYRLREFEWCDDLTDYIDIYF